MGSQLVKIALQADVGGFVSGFSQAEGAVGKFGATLSGLTRIGGAVGSAIDAVAEKARTFAKHVAAGGIAGTAFFGGLGIAAAQLEVPMRNVQTLMGKGFGEKQFQQMTQDIINMSRRLPQSAVELANGMYDIASSGFAGAEGMKILDVSATAAVAGLTSTKNASTAVTAALNAYGKGASAAGDMSDILFQTVNLGVVSFEQLTGVIGDAVGTAAAAKVNFAEVGSAIATMTRSGISAEESGTSLNRLLQSIIDPSDALAGAIRGLGYESGATALEQDGLRKVMMKLMEASKGNIGVLLQWFPEIRAARGALALMANEGRTYNEVAAGIEDKNKRAGASQRAFAIQSQSAVAEFKLFINSLKAAGMEIGQYFLPAAKLIISAATSITNVFGSMSAPMKQVIAWAGLLGSALTALGGIFLAWRLKTAVMNVALQGIGAGFKAVGERSAGAGGMLSQFGTRLSNTQGPFGITRAVLGSTFDLFGRFGESVGRAGNRITEFGGHMGRGGGLVSGFGNTLKRAEGASHALAGGLGAVGKAASSLVGILPAAAAVGMALFSAFQQGKASADAMAESLTKNMNEKDPVSLVKNYDKVRAKLDDVNKALEKPHQGGIFDQIVESAKQAAVNIADETTNIVGIDAIDTSSWDRQFQLDSLNKTEKKIVNTMHNISKNATEVFNTMHPEAALGHGKMLGLDSQELIYIARVAETTGVDLTKAFSKSGPERQKAMQEIQKMTGFMGDMGNTGTAVSAAMVQQYAAMAKAADKAAEGAAKAFTKSFDLFKSVDPSKTFGQMLGGEDTTLVPMQAQIANFYATSLETARKFYDGISEMQKRGADPSVIQKMLQAGPEAAGAVVQAAVEDTTNATIQVLNAGESALRQFSQRAAEIARLTQAAISDPTDKKVQQLGDAIQIANEKMTQGGLATTESVAKALHMDPASVNEIAHNFGMGLRGAIKPEEIFKGFITEGESGPVSQFQTHLLGVVDAMRQFTGTQPETIISLAKGLGKVLNMPDVTPGELAKKREAIEKLYNQAAEIPGQQDKTITFKILGDEIAKDRMRDVLNAAFGPGRENQGARGLTAQQIDFIVGLQGDAEAIAKIGAISAALNLTPHEHAVMLRALGTEEAIHQANLLDAAIEVLHGKNLPITADAVQAIIASGEAQDHIDGVEQKSVPGIAADPTAAQQGARDAQAAIDSIQGKNVPVTVSVTLTGEQLAVDTYRGQVLAGGGSAARAYASAYGSLWKDGVQAFAQGGMIGDGKKAILWNEPGTGGESYIPWAMDRRDRATEILQRTAEAFGYSLVRGSVKAYAGGGMQYPAQSSTAWTPASTTIATTIQFNAPIYGDSGLQNHIQNAFDEHDRQLSIRLRQNRGGR